MTLDRWIALAFVAFCCLYGYAAFFTMDAQLAPFMRRNPVWPSTFPKALAVLGAAVGLVVVLGIERGGPKADPGPSDMSLSRLREYKVGQALGLLAMMVAYALALRPAGFLLATAAFLVGGSLILGERRWVAMILAAGVATATVWYLVQEVLGIFLRPLPYFLG